MLSKKSSMKTKYISILGLVINSIGALISVLSLTTSDGNVTSQSGIEYHIAVISDIGFRVGLYLLILGFLFQILEKLSKEESVPYPAIILIVISSLSLYKFAFMLTPILFR